MPIPEVQGVAESTYRQTYRGKLPEVPPIKYKTMPCMYPPGSTQPCRQVQPQAERPKLKRVTQPVGPVPNPLAHGPPAVPAGSASGVQRPRSSKRNVVDNKVIQTKFGPMDMTTITRLHDRHRYSTHASRAMAECYVPPRPGAAPLEQSPQLRPDMVELTSWKYEDAPGDWQGLVLWDRLQNRDQKQPPPLDTPRYYQEDTLPRRKIISQVDEKVRAKHDQILDLVQKEKLANVFTMKIPGCAGYAPICPPHTVLDEKKTPSNKISLMSDSYKRFADKEYAVPDYGRQIINWDAISLAYPINPLMKGNFRGGAAQNKNSYVGGTGYMLIG